MISSDVIVIGGGVVGAASAFFIARAGFKVTILEKRNALGLLTTSASLAAFRAQFAEPENIAMMQESIAFFKNIREETGLPDADIGMVQQGYLFCTTTTEGVERTRKRVALQHALGLRDVELWDGEETRKHFSFITPDVRASSFRAQDGWLSPNDLTNVYARASHAEIVTDAEVSEILHAHGAVKGVRTKHGEFHAPVVVIAAGPFVKQFAAALGVELPISLVRRQHAAIKQHPLIPHYAPMTIDSDTGAHWRPEGRGAILAMNTAETPGEPLDFVQGDWDFPALVLDAVTRLSPFWEQISTNLRQDDLDVRAGQYDMTPDAKPIIDSHPQIRGVYFHCGYSGHGVMGSATGARILADLIAGTLNRAGNAFSLTRLDNFNPLASEKMVL